MRPSMRNVCFSYSFSMYVINMVHKTQKTGVSAWKLFLWITLLCANKKGTGHAQNRTYITWESMTESLRIERWVGRSHFCTMGPWEDSGSQLGAIVTLGKPRGIRQNREEQMTQSVVCCRGLCTKNEVPVLCTEGVTGTNIALNNCQRPIIVTSIHSAMYQAFVLLTCVNTLVQKQQAGWNSYYVQNRMAAYREKNLSLRFDMQTDSPALQQHKDPQIRIRREKACSWIADKFSTISNSKRSTLVAMRIKTSEVTWTGALYRPGAWLWKWCQMFHSKRYKFQNGLIQEKNWPRLTLPCHWRRYPHLCFIQHEQGQSYYVRQWDENS